jgi:transposase-like protein
VVRKVGKRIAQILRRSHTGYGDTFYIDEVFVNPQGILHYLWRAVDQDGEVVDCTFSNGEIHQRPSDFSVEY